MEWAYADIPNEQLTPIQRTVFKDEWRKLGYEIENNPHITIVPGYESNEDVTKPSLKKQKIQVSGFNFYPSESKPMVVMLDVSQSSELSRLREEFVSQIGRENIKYGLHPYHVTLFKAGDSGDENEFQITEEVADSIVSSCREATTPSSLSIKNIRIENWDT